MRNKYLLYIGIFLCMGIWACSNDAVYYDVNQKRSIYFTWDRYNSVTKTASDTVFFSFALYNETEYEYRVPIKVAGMPLGEELTYEVEVVADSSTAKYDKHFKFGKLVIPKNEVEGYLSIILDRTEDIMDHPVTRLMIISWRTSAGVSTRIGRRNLCGMLSRIVPLPR